MTSKMLLFKFSSADFPDLTGLDNLVVELYLKMSTRGIILSPILRVLKFVGILIDQQNLNLWTCYPVLISVYLVLQYCLNLSSMYPKSLNKKSREVIRILAATSTSICELLFALFSVTVPIFKRHKKNRIIRKLDEIEMYYVLIKIRYKYSKREWTLYMIIAASIGLFCIIFDIVSLPSCVPDKFYLIFILHYSSRVISWIDLFYFLTILKIIRLHYTRLNDELIVMTEMLRRRWIRSNNEFLIKMKIISEIHNLLRETSRAQNSVYKLQFLAFATFLINTITTYTYFLITKHTDVNSKRSALDTNSLSCDIYYVFWLSTHSALCVIVLRSICRMTNEVKAC